MYMESHSLFCYVGGILSVCYMCGISQRYCRSVVSPPWRSLRSGPSLFVSVESRSVIPVAFLICAGVPRRMVSPGLFVDVKSLSVIALALLVHHGVPWRLVWMWVRTLLGMVGCFDVWCSLDGGLFSNAYCFVGDLVVTLWLEYQLMCLTACLTLCRSCPVQAYKWQFLGLTPVIQEHLVVRSVSS